MPEAALDPGWHVLATDEVARRLAVDPTSGLAPATATRRLAEVGPNEIEERRGRPPWRMLLDQFSDFMILVLIAAAVISGVVGEPHDTIAIVVIVVLNAAVGFVQEYRAERAIAALRRLAAPTARVLRAGAIARIAARDVVPGDVLLLEAGDAVTADARLIEAAGLRVDESALTGESEPVEKTSGALEDGDLPLADRSNMAYRGTTVTAGRGLGIVAATGMATALGGIASLLAAGGAERTPLQRRLAQFGQRLGIAVLIICAGIFALGLARGGDLVLMFLTAVSLAVAAVPEALPAIVTVGLAIGARKMVRRNALIRRLPAVETLGSVTYICADKTGTLTENRMRLERLWVDGRLEATPPTTPRSDQPWSWLIRGLALNNDAMPGDDGVRGDPTEVALFVAAAEAGFDKTVLARQWPRIAELPFDAERKRMTTFHEGPEGPVAFTKGAPEQIAPRCTLLSTSTGAVPFDPDAILAAAERLAGQGYRVLGFAMRSWPMLPDEPAHETAERDLTFLGLAAIMDPPRPEASDAVAACRSAGIVPVMITGDHPATARAIALRLGILDDDDGPVLTGRDLDQTPLERLEAVVERVRVYARVSPEQKITIVRALQDRGEFVAMTGDGVNDAPALKRADIGVAMGLRGTDVAREAADMVLLDDNFATIVAAVREGRRIYDNLRKFIKDTMSSNSGEILTLLLAPLLGLPLPLLPIHILWINLLTDGLPGLAFAAEPAERGVMRRPPRAPDESVFAHGMWQHMLWAGLFTAALSIGAQAWAYGTGSPHWQTIVFTVLTLAQLGHSLAVRSERESLLTIGLFSNPAMLAAVVLMLLLQLATIYVPALNPIFKTAPLPPLELAICLAAPGIVLIAVEIEKSLVRRGLLYRR